ncbi:regulatory LuxR family protein [Saccharothrix carnea]|uniref:Regulatory LuxR family protein n=1 Tax=Saccharothrix carnea TaxID=1280637 RepID=A0A2P8IEU7_SACCR|nr:helix-turn-helix transcriptional regulator [Saccharothrix carnea]PSL56973.1 regulatory LuxR family protein [Saccharothrix carnea]
MDPHRSAGVADERARPAREIHDTVAQGLTGIVTQLEAVDGLPPGPARSLLEIAADLARTSLVEVRRSIGALRPGPLQDARLGDAVRQAVTTWREQYGVPATAREREVLALVAEGRTNRETAARLYLSEATVKTHLLHIYAKLEVIDRASAVAAAYRRGILDG